MQSMTTNHEQCWDDIPWLVNGRLSEAEQQRVLMHAENCTECGEELRQQREVHAQLRGTQGDMEMSDASWNKLLARIDAQPQHPAEEDQLIGTMKPRRQRWMVAAVWAQGVAIAGLLAALLVPQRGAEYVTLSASDSRPQGSLRVVFAPSASLDRVNTLLREVSAEIVAGPSEAGVYTVAVANRETASAIAELRQHDEVLFAESTAAAGEPHR
ncbi:MAG: zf-HC2 domain-containing protein [Steroidobacteraceae bacterium]